MVWFGLSLGWMLNICPQAILPEGVADAIPQTGVAYTSALPPSTEIPEEILRTEIITEARSPLDGTPLNAAEYAELQERLQTSPFPPSVSPEIEQTVFLLRLLKFFRTVLPFL